MSDYKKATSGIFFSMELFLYLHYINVNTLVMVFYCIVLQDITIVGNSVMGIQEILFLTIACEYIKA